MAKCTDHKTAGRYMNAMLVYHFGGWTAFFESVNQSEEEK